MASEWAEDDSEVELRLQRWIDGEASGPSMPILALFTNDFHPVPGEVIGDLTLPSDLDCPDPTVPGDQWGTVTISAHIAESIHDLTRVFTNVSGSTIYTVYGYVFLNDAGTVVRWAERFATARVLSPSDKLDLTPTRREKTTPP